LICFRAYVEIGRWRSSSIVCGTAPSADFVGAPLPESYCTRSILTQSPVSRFSLRERRLTGRVGENVSFVTAAVYLAFNAPQIFAERQTLEKDGNENIDVCTKAILTSTSSPTNSFPRLIAETNFRRLFSLREKRLTGGVRKNVSFVTACSMIPEPSSGHLLSSLHRNPPMKIVNHPVERGQVNGLDDAHVVQINVQIVVGERAQLAAAETGAAESG